MGQSRWLIAATVVTLSFVLPASICAGMLLLQPGSVVGLAAGALAAAVWMVLLFLVNYHYGFGRHRTAGVGRSMRYAMDVVEVGPWGCESHGFLRRRREAYRIWNRPPLAPCDGVVVHAENGVEDNAGFGSHRPYGIGNHVVIEAGAGLYVVLGHLRQGTVAVTPGDRVRTGQELGRVGNSGWTERPHLHMQAMRSPDADWWHGEPLAMHFGGRFAVRNDVIQV
jgi:hypothetical protein